MRRAVAMARPAALAAVAALALVAPARAQDLSELGIELRASGWTVTIDPGGRIATLTRDAADLDRARPAGGRLRILLDGAAPATAAADDTTVRVVEDPAEARVGRRPAVSIGFEDGSLRKRVTTTSFEGRSYRFDLEAEAAAWDDVVAAMERVVASVRFLPRPVAAVVGGGRAPVGAGGGPGVMVAAGRPIVVSFADLPGTADWLTIVPEGTPDDQYHEWYWTDGSATVGRPAGEPRRNGRLTFGALPPGRYELRLYLDWPDSGYRVQDRRSLVVTGGAQDVRAIDTPAPAPARVGGPASLGAPLPTPARTPAATPATPPGSTPVLSLDLPDLGSVDARIRAARQLLPWLERVIADAKDRRVILVEAPEPLGFLVVDPAALDALIAVRSTGASPDRVRDRVEARRPFAIGAAEDMRARIADWLARSGAPPAVAAAPAGPRSRNRPAAPAATLVGEWRTQSDGASMTVRLWAEGGIVEGTYDHRNGRIENGRLTGSVLVFTWRDESGSFGDGRFVLAGDWSTFTGWWRDQTTGGTGTWNGARPDAGPPPPAASSTVAAGGPFAGVPGSERADTSSLGWDFPPIMYGEGDGWTSTWTRRGTTDVFDVVHGGPGGAEVVTVEQASWRGETFHVQRLSSSDRILCELNGTRSADRTAIETTGTCPGVNSGWRVRLTTTRPGATPPGATLPGGQPPVARVPPAVATPPAARTPTPAIAATSSLGSDFPSIMYGEGDGWTSTWTRRGTTDVFDAVHRGPGGAEVVTVEQASWRGETFHVQRLSSTDAILCELNGTRSADRMAIEATGTCPGVNSGWRVRLTTTRPGATPPVVAAPPAVTAPPATRTPPAGIAATSSLGSDFPSVMYGEGDGWTSTWTRRGTSDVFDAVHRGPGGAEVVTVEQASWRGETFHVQRLSSTDGILCELNGTRSADRMAIETTGTCPGVNSGWRVRLTTTRPGATPPVVATPPAARVPPAGIAATSSLGSDFPSVMYGEGDGWTSTWTRRGTSDVFDVVHRGPGGAEVVTTEQASWRGETFHVQRLSSTDGILCELNGTRSADRMAIETTGTCPGVNSGWRVRLTTTRHGSTPPSVATPPVVAAPPVARVPPPAIASTSSLGPDFPSLMHGEGDGWTSTWTRRGTSDLFDVVHRGPGGVEVVTVEQASWRGETFHVQRLSSTDGILCELNGTRSADGRAIDTMGRCPGLNSWRVRLAAGGGPPPAAHVPPAGIAATGSLGSDFPSVLHGQADNGWTSTWTRRGTSDVFDVVHQWPGGGGGVVTVEQASWRGETFHVQRLSSSDGILCIMNGARSADGRAIDTTGECPGVNSGWRVRLTAGAP